MLRIIIDKIKNIWNGWIGGIIFIIIVLIVLHFLGIEIFPNHQYEYISEEEQLRMQDEVEGQARFPGEP